MTSNFSDNHQSGYPTGSLTRSPSSPRTLFNSVMTVVAFICAVLAIIPLVAVLSYVLFQGFSSLSISNFTELPPPPIGKITGGFGNAILGTILMVGVAALISIPFGVMAAIYLTEFSSGKISRTIRFATNILSGVPSIIAGVFAYGVIVLTLQRLGLGSYSAIGGGFALAILMLPIIVRTTDEALQLVSQDLRQAAVGVGATNFQTVTQVVLPAALPAIVTGATLSIARASGETAPLLFTALFSQFWPKSLFEPTASLAVLVYNYAISPFKNWQSLAWAASLILVLMVLVTSIIARWATRQKVY
ncbi:MAG: phosphate ABC transporter permease PstA [Cyanomargarita calcarea GSE-NOS-MK-12-04C]|uniref:Phosphate transport system permease protein PstA n=1 Tax=Cyanomargarita calcarea GSE-NOS-MK-12-04C TaxID=2839659 RepID=A0A951QQN2_9CYAN|nr:phosphate ABC transporter permease PstA [Cyanomargarita calcarea GSE-NOS-MK-12-04C]